MGRAILSDDQWKRVKDLLPGKSSDCGVTAADNRLFLEAVLWIARTGSPWRDLPGTEYTFAITAGRIKTIGFAFWYLAVPTQRRLEIILSSHHALPVLISNICQ